MFDNIAAFEHVCDHSRMRIDQLRNIDQLPKHDRAEWETVNPSPPHAGRTINVYQVSAWVVEVSGGYKARSVVLYPSQDEAHRDAHQIMKDFDGRGQLQEWTRKNPTP